MIFNTGTFCVIVLSNSKAFFNNVWLTFLLFSHPDLLSIKPLKIHNTYHLYFSQLYLYYPIANSSRNDTNLGEIIRIPKSKSYQCTGYEFSKKIHYIHLCYVLLPKTYSNNLFPKLSRVIPSNPNRYLC